MKKAANVPAFLDTKFGLYSATWLIFLQTYVSAISRYWAYQGVGHIKVLGISRYWAYQGIGHIKVLGKDLTTTLHTSGVVCGSLTGSTEKNSGEWGLP